MVCYKMDSRQVLSKDKGRSMRGMARFASLRNQSTSPCHKALMTKALCKMGFVLRSPARPRVIRKCPRSARVPPSLNSDPERSRANPARHWSRAKVPLSSRECSWVPRAPQFPRKVPSRSHLQSKAL